MSFFEISLVCLYSHPYCVLGLSDKTLSSSALRSPLVRYTNGCSSSVAGSWIAVTPSTGGTVSLCMFPQHITDIINFRQKKIRHNVGKYGSIIRIYFHSKYTLKDIYTSNSGQKHSRALSQMLNWIKLIKYVWLKSIVSLNSVERNFFSRLSY